jgi:parvulin-like peptidyl-prolyl isomerase
MLRVIRENTKWIFYILAISFIGWLVFDVGMGITGRGQYGGADVVLKVNGSDVHLPAYNEALQAGYEQVRRQTGASLTREEEQQIQNQVVDELIQTLLLDQQYRKLGMTVTDQELIQAAQTSPPPDVLQAPEFQTNGQFDIAKWQRFLASSSDPQFMQSLEARYRQQIPQVKLIQYLTADIYIPDEKLWRIYRDQHEAVTAAVVAIRADQIADQDAPVSEDEIQRYYDAHIADFKRPAVAYLSFIAQPRLPLADDSAAALAHVRRVRAEIARGAKFEDVAKRESRDTATAAHGGDLGWIKRDEPGFDPQFMTAVRRLSTGAVSEPVLSAFGYHIIRVDGVRGDSVHVRHILVPVELLEKHLEYVEGRADTLDKVAAEQSNGAVLDSVARQLNLPLARGYRLIEGERLTLGRYAIPDVSVWAFETRVGETSPVIEGYPAFYVFRLDSLTPAGTPPLARIHDVVKEAAQRGKKGDAARRRAEDLAQQLAGTASLLDAAAAHGVVAQKLGPFTRLTPPPILQGSPVAIGAAFGLAPGMRTGVVAGNAEYFIIQTLSRTAADSAAWLKQKDAQRESVLQPARQARIQAYLAELRARAKIVDRRKELFAPPPASAS